jgi:hypothetical protein
MDQGVGWALHGVSRAGGATTASRAPPHRLRACALRGLPRRLQRAWERFLFLFYFTFIHFFGWSHLIFCFLFYGFLTVFRGNSK